MKEVEAYAKKFWYCDCPECLDVCELGDDEDLKNAVGTFECECGEVFKLSSKKESSEEE